MSGGTMILIGMYDSPFTRRVAIALALLGLPFEQRDWSVGADFDRIREYSPLGRVPVLVLDDGEVLTESAAILDWLEHEPGGGVLLPAGGHERREAMRLIGLASGAADRCVAGVLERIFHPQEHRSAALLERGRIQVEGALAALDAACAARGDGWLAGEAMTLADVTVACHSTYASQSLPVDLSRWPSLSAHVARCEALDVFRAHYAPFFTPQPKGAKESNA
jgi:glutathione S-transferase